MATAGEWGQIGRSGLVAGVTALLVASCGDLKAAPVDEVVTSGVSEDEPAAPDASGCNVQLAPTLDIPVPAVLATPGPWQLCGSYGTGPAHLLTTSYDSRRLALVTDNGQVWVLGARDFKLLGVFAHAAGAITFAGLSPDGKLLATVDDPAGRVAIWNVAKHKLLRVLTRPPAPRAFYGLGAVTFSHDGSRLAVVSSSHIDVFDTATGAPLPISSRNDLGWAMSVAFVASDTRLVLGRFTYFGNGPYAGWGGVDMVDAATGNNLVTLDKEFYIDLPTIAVSGDGNTIAVGSTQASRSLTFFDAQTGQVTRDLEISGQPLALDWAGTQVAVGVGDGSANPTVISVRNVADGTVVETVSVPPPTSYPRDKLFAVPPDLSAVLVGDVAPAVLTRLKMVNGRTHAVACGSGHFSDVAGLAISADGGTLVSTGDYYDGRQLAWNVATGAPVTPVPPPEGLRQPRAISPDGTVQAVPSADDFSPTFDLRDTATGAVIRTIGPQPTRPRAFDFAPDGALIASSSERDPVDRGGKQPVAELWTPATGAHQQSLRILSSAPSYGPQAVLFGDVDHLFVAGYSTTARWCRTGAP